MKMIFKLEEKLKCQKHHIKQNKWLSYLHFWNLYKENMLL